VISKCYPHDVMSVTRHIKATYLAKRARPGAVIVVHERWHTAETLRKALPLIAKRGLQLGTLSELQAAADAETTFFVRPTETHSAIHCNLFWRNFFTRHRLL